MKILAKFLLSSVFVFSAGAPVWAQDCGHGYFWNHDQQSAIDDLEKRQDCLNAKLQDQDNDYLKIKIYGLQDKLKQTELDLQIAGTKIETLEGKPRTVEDEIQELQLRFPIPSHRAIKKSDGSKPKAPAGKPAGPLNKPTPEGKEGAH